MDSVTYNITADLVPEYAGRRVIVRTHDPADLVHKIGRLPPANVAYVQLTSPQISAHSLDLLSRWGRGIPVDLLLRKPADDFRQLYNFSNLVDRHPIRATVTVDPGFTNAVKLALALGFAVKLEVGQPNERTVEEIAAILELYLHGVSVSQPVDYFHSIFQSFFDREQASLWMILEEDPEHFIFVESDGTETVAERLASSQNIHDVGVNGDRSNHKEMSFEVCSSCEFNDICRGYFKLPDPYYDCTGVISIFTTLKNSAEQLRLDIESASTVRSLTL